MHGARCADLASGKGDVTLVELLSETTPFAAKDILCTAPCKDLPRFPKSSSDRPPSCAQALEDSLDVHYYLAQARPFHAFHHMLHSIKDALSSPLLNPYVLLSSIPASFFTRPLQERTPDTEGVIPFSPDEVSTPFIRTTQYSLTVRWHRNVIFAGMSALWRFVTLVRRQLQVLSLPLAAMLNERKVSQTEMNRAVL